MSAQVAGQEAAGSGPGNKERRGDDGGGGRRGGRGGSKYLSDTIPRTNNITDCPICGKHNGPHIYCKQCGKSHSGKCRQWCTLCRTSAHSQKQCPVRPMTPQEILREGVAEATRGAFAAINQPQGALQPGTIREGTARVMRGVFAQINRQQAELRRETRAAHGASNRGRSSGRRGSGGRGSGRSAGHGSGRGSGENQNTGMPDRSTRDGGAPAGRSERSPRGSQ